MQKSFGFFRAFVLESVLLCLGVFHLMLSCLPFSVGRLVHTPLFLSSFALPVSTLLFFLCRTLALPFPRCALAINLYFPSSFYHIYSHGRDLPSYLPFFFSFPSLLPMHKSKSKQTEGPPSLPLSLLPSLPPSLHGRIPHQAIPHSINHPNPSPLPYVMQSRVFPPLTSTTLSPR